MSVPVATLSRQCRSLDRIAGPPAPRSPFLWLLALCFASAAWLSPASAPAQQRTVLAHQEAPLPDVPYDANTLAVVVSTDGSRSVPVVKLGDGFRVLDGHPGQTYDALGPGSPLLSTDGRHCAFVGRRENVWLNETLWYVTFDGIELGPFFNVQPHSLSLSPDGNWLACVAARRDGMEAVCVFSPENPVNVRSGSGCAASCRSARGLVATP